MITSHDRPRLREDLVAEAIEDRGARFIDVIDPDNGNSYRFYDVEYSLACAMDGQRDIPGLVRWAEEELGIAPTRGELETVIATLGDLGYLDRIDQAAVHADVAAGDLGLAAGVHAAAPVAPASGIDVELGHFQPPVAAAARAEPVAELELGVSGGGPKLLEIDDDVPDVTLGPSGGSAPVLPVPTSGIGRPGSQPAMSARSKSETLRGEGRLSESSIAQPKRPSEKQVRPAPPAAAARRSEPKLGGTSDPSLNLNLAIGPDDVKEAVRQSREMRSVDVPPELMQALEAAEQPGPASVPPRGRPATTPPLAASALPPPSSARPAAVASTAMPSSAVLDPIAPLSGAPLSVSEPISPASVPPLVPVARAESRGERDARPEARVAQRSEPPAAMRTKSEPRLDYPRSAEPRPLTPAPREVPSSIPPPMDLAPPRRSSVWIVAVLVVAILGVVGFGVWKFVVNKPAVTEQAPVKVGGSDPSVDPSVTASGGSSVTQPTTPVEPPAAAPTAKLSLVNPPPTSVKMPAAGVLLSVVAAGTIVKESDEVARLGSAKQLEKEIAAAKGDLEKRYPVDVARLKAKLAAQPNNRDAQAGLKAREARIAQRTKDLEGFEAELAKHVLTAKSAGKVTAVAKAGARLAAEAEVASIEEEPYLSGAVDLGKPVTSQPGDLIEVKLKGAEATTLSCKLETVQGNKAGFRCPVAEGFADGAEVVVEPK